MKVLCETPKHFERHVGPAPLPALLVHTTMRGGGVPPSGKCIILALCFNNGEERRNSGDVLILMYGGRPLRYAFLSGSAIQGPEFKHSF